MASTFGEVVEQLGALKNLFGGQGNSVPDRQSFSSQPAQENMAMQNASAFQAALQNLGVSKDAAGFGSGLSSQGYQDKLNADYNQAVKLKNLNQGAGGGSASFGKGAFQPSGYTTNAYGQRSLYNASDVANWGLMQSSAINSVADFAKAEAEGDIARAMGQADAQKHLIAAQTQADTARMQREQAFQGMQSAAERGSRERVASTQAQASILSSLFGSVGAGSPNYRYWG